MWSIVQYNRIGQQVEEDEERRSNVKRRWKNNSILSKNPLKLRLSKFTRPSFHNHLRVPSEASSPTNHSTIFQHGAYGFTEEIDSTSRIVVELDGEEDPFDPCNWPASWRWKNIMILSLLIFTQGWAGAADSIANTEISRDFHLSKVSENLATAMYLFGIGCGSIFAGPVSETVGRNPVYLVATLFYLLFILGSALTSTFGVQVVCRFFVGLFASGTLAINGSSVGDQFRPVERSLVFPFLAWANVASPVIAPIAGGWIVSNPNLGWRWTEWTTFIISVFAFITALLFLPETYLPVLLDWKAKHLRRVTGKNYVSEHAQSTIFVQRLKTVLPMPIKFFTSEPVIMVLGGYLVLLYILLFTFLSGFDYIFQKTYDLTPGLTGSCFASIALGSTLFTSSAPVSYYLARRKQKINPDAPFKPEFRLWPAIFVAPLLPVSLFWLGWTNSPSISIWSGLGACFLFGIIVTAMYVSSYQYIIDSYGDRAAIALTSITMARYLISGGMVMAARPMYEGIGVHWTMTLLGIVALLLAPAPFFFWKYGGKLRSKSPYAVGDDLGS